MVAHRYETPDTQSQTRDKVLRAHKASFLDHVSMKYRATQKSMSMTRCSTSGADDRGGLNEAEKQIPDHNLLCGPSAGVAEILV